jgi:hypothetical protein
MNKDELTALADDPILMEVGRRAVEDELVDFRDSGIFILRNNGLVIKGKDGSNSHIIRLSAVDAVRIALRAIADVSATEVAALRALHDADPVTPELVSAYEAEHAKAQDHQEQPFMTTDSSELA